MFVLCFFLVVVGFFFAFVFLFAPTTLPEIFLPQRRALRPKERNSAGSSCCRYRN